MHTFPDYFTYNLREEMLKRGGRKGLMTVTKDVHTCVSQSVKGVQVISHNILSFRCISELPYEITC